MAVTEEDPAVPLMQEALDGIPETMFDALYPGVSSFWTSFALGVLYISTSSLVSFDIL
jgi:hypothetical protein